MSGWKEWIHSEAEPVYVDVGGAPRKGPIPQQIDPEKVKYDEKEAAERSRKHRVSQMLFGALPGSKTPHRIYPSEARTGRSCIVKISLSGINGIILGR